MTKSVQAKSMEQLHDTRGKADVDVPVFYCLTFVLLRRELVLLLLAILLPLIIYLPSLSEYVLLEDDGLFLAVGETLGIAHPPGYPLYTLLLWAFMQLPFSTPALAGHALSALIGAFGCGALYLSGRLLGLSALISLGTIHGVCDFPIN